MVERRSKFKSRDVYSICHGVHVLLNTYDFSLINPQVRLTDKAYSAQNICFAFLYKALLTFLLLR
jgi:hypothetical protein